MMMDLLPLSAYERQDFAETWRTILVMSALWGIPMTAIGLFVLLVGGAGVGLAGLLHFGLLGVAAGLFFGTLWTFLFRLGMRKLLRRIYVADPAIVPPPPAGRYDYRLPCSYMASPRMAVGGHLYVGPAELTFVPHYKNLKRHRVPLVIEVIPSMLIESFDAELTGLARLMVKGPVRRVRIVSGGADASFVVPEPEDVVSRISEYVRGFS